MLKYFPETAKTVLEVGCGEGRFASTLKQRFGVVVWGIELEPLVAERAAQRLDRVLVGDASELIAGLPDQFFECIVFNDALEHFVDPVSLLTGLLNKMRPQGWVLCSIPNVMHLSVLKGLLIDRDFRYRDSGVLDETHLRFFTRRSIRRMFGSLGFQVELIEGIGRHRSWAFSIVNVLTLGFYRDAAATQFACRFRLAS
jgi:2-polyprenyl-3-methyl-5-hydroxy-6-metoxy-1,4-benzoquinol methylase